MLVLSSISSSLELSPCPTPKTRFRRRVRSGTFGDPLSDTFVRTKTPSASTLTLILRLSGEGGLENRDDTEEIGEEGGDEDEGAEGTLNKAVLVSVLDEVGLAVATVCPLRVVTVIVLSRVSVEEDVDWRFR